MGRAPCCEKIGLKKGPWTSEEDEKLVTFINQHGHGSWRALPKKAGLLRCGKSCRLRWTNYLRPDIKRGEFSPGEEQSIIQLHALLGNRWSAIASHLPKRTDNEIKNYWNTHLKKRLLKMGIDPATHKPKTETTSSLLESTSNGTAAVSHMAQWESARLEAEARLARESKMRASGLWPAAAATIFPILPSSSKLWNPLASSVLSEHYQCSPSRKGFNALELMNIVQNWEKSLQGQAGLMWPDSWKPSSVNMSDQQESSCCSSRHTDEMDHGSPTSTLCSLEANLQNVACTPGSSSAMDIRKLSWNDDCMFKEIVAAAMKGQPFSGLDNIRNPHLAKSCEVEDVLHSGDAGLTDSVDAENLSGLHSFQDLVMAAACDTHSPSPWSHASDAALSREVCNTADSGNIPALASATTSSSLLGELELATEDISSNKGAYSPVVCGEVSPEYQRSSGSARQNTSYSALLTEEFPDYWSNIMKPLE